ncbi:glycosyltransferase family A protein [Polaribacter atrinae]|uniref:glycosyltransferase family A protein n=1 Tax=Polaribacter atrinae TaxID=1333662 RepID=UPI0030FC9963
MRIGKNPEKEKFTPIVYRQHRVIVPVFIPDLDELYFNNLFSVFKASLNSLIKTTDQKETNITIINNNCKEEVTNYIDHLLKQNLIDKHIKLSSNYGKIYTILAEARASYEQLITIADADVFYFSNWLTETKTIFKEFKKAGAVAPLPMPQLAFYSNNSLFFNNFLKIKKGKVVKDCDLSLFEESIASKISLKKNNWFKNQLYLERNNVKSCVGAGHFIATYRKTVLDKIPLEKPKYIFENGGERFHLDAPIDQLGYYRLSTIKTFVYHLGNTIPKWVEEYSFEEFKTTKLDVKNNFSKTYIPYKLKEVIAKVYRKLITI